MKKTITTVILVLAGMTASDSLSAASLVGAGNCSHIVGKREPMT